MEQEGERMTYVEDFKREGSPDESLDEFCKRKNYPLAPEDCILCPRALQIDGDPSIIRCSDSRYDGKKCPI